MRGRGPHGGIIIKTPQEIERIRAAGRIVHQALTMMGRAVAPGVTTQELEDIAVQVISAAGATSAFLGYQPIGHTPFPAWTCISVNDEVVHGIGGPRVLHEGDIVSCDCGVKLNGYYADSAWTFPVGKVDPETDKLLKVTREALQRAIAAAKPGNRIGDIGYTVERFVRQNGYSVVRDMVGHGVGTALHEDPQIPNYGKPKTGPVLREGMTLAIEPMVNIGTAEIAPLSDGWTVVTADGQKSAHFEHTIVVTRHGARILTQGD
jgi:methionyl aminopeptidase